MEILYQFVAPPSPCSYLPDQEWSLQYQRVLSLSAEEYMRYLVEGWRRFGTMLFRPRCPACNACRTLRVPVERFKPNRSQRRAWKRNCGDVALQIREPGVSATKLSLYDRFHRFQTEKKGWPEYPAKDAASYRESFVYNPFFSEEWCYYLDGKLVGVGYVDSLAQGLSAIYFFYEPRLRERSLGTFNVLKVVEQARKRNIPHVYLGYYVPGCASLEYKANFRPNEIIGPDGQWKEFLTA
jgi:arginyl-tRNA--protein-N-Asp/Glu arginylyltransferase